MRYHNITKDDMLNGAGLRVVLWVAGCAHCCKECHNPITWDPNGGLEFDEEAKQEIFDELKNQSLTQYTGTEAEGHAYSVNNKISDGEIRNLHILYGV